MAAGKMTPTHSGIRGHKILIARAGNFFGPGAANNWFSQVLVKPG